MIKIALESTLRCTKGHVTYIDATDATKPGDSAPCMSCFREWLATQFSATVQDVHEKMFAEACVARR